MGNDIPNLLNQPSQSSSQTNQDPVPPVKSKSPQTGPAGDLSLDNLPPLLKVSEVAKILRVSPLTVKRWTRRGRLPAIRINSRGDRRYRKETILYYLGIQQR